MMDAAVGLQELGHQVQVYTSHHDSTRCFQETRDGPLPLLHFYNAKIDTGTVKVRVLGDSLFSMTTRGKLTLVCSILRQLHLVLSLALSIRLGHDTPNIFVIDQPSACMPLLRWLTNKRAVFYCHFSLDECRAAKLKSAQCPPTAVSDALGPFGGRHHQCVRFFLQAVAHRDS
jgi:alpha-1,3/alpha-1,6-mannosyltransferase